MINENRLFGHDKILKNLINLYDNKSLPNKILLTGKRGIGKSLIVEHLINYIFSQEEDYKYNIDDLKIDKNNRSHILYINNTHPNIFKISKKTDKKNIEVSQIRDLLLFQNRSSFNDKIRCIIIDDAEYLNLSSTSALLKSVEEPNNQILYLIINNSEKQISETLKSRCINFKVNLKLNDIKSIVNNYFNEDIYDQIPRDFIDFYNTPSFIISMIDFMKDKNIQFNSLTIDEFIINIIKDKFYIKDKFIKENLNYFIELFFYKNINRSNNLSYKIKEYFYVKLSEIKKYNLDMETFFLEFEEKLLSE